MPNLSWKVVVVGLVVVVALASLLLWCWPQQAVQGLDGDPLKLRELQRAYTATGAQILLGMAVLAGVVLTLLRVQAIQSQAESAQHQVEIARRQQITERFTRAGEQLGSEKPSVRLGGVYALEKIAQDEPEAYFNQFREVLAAFVREEAREPHPDKRGKLLRLPTDLQAALTVLGRNPPPAAVEAPVLIDLSGACLTHARLEGAHLEAAELVGTDLRHATLRKANFRKAWLPHVDLEEAHLQDAYLEGANFHKACLIGAEMAEVDLSETYLRKADLSGAELYGADLSGADLGRANLSGTDLGATNLCGANLRKAKWDGATNLSEARYNNQTRFPKDFTPPEDMIYVEDGPEDEP